MSESQHRARERGVRGVVARRLELGHRPAALVTAQRYQAQEKVGARRTRSTARRDRREPRDRHVELARAICRDRVQQRIVGGGGSVRVTDHAERSEGVARVRVRRVQGQRAAIRDRRGARIAEGTRLVSDVAVRRALRRVATCDLDRCGAAEIGDHDRGGEQHHGRKWLSSAVASAPCGPG